MTLSTHFENFIRWTRPIRHVFFGIFPCIVNGHVMHRSKTFAIEKENTSLLGDEYYYVFAFFVPHWTF